MKHESINMNQFSALHHYEHDRIIETPNQYRNARKRLNKLKNKKGENNSPEEIRKLTILMNEYENNNNNNNNRKCRKKKRIMEIKINEDEFLNKEIEKMKTVKEILLKEKNKQLSICKEGNKRPSMWKYNHHMCYPISFRITMNTIFCIHNRTGTLLNMLPKDLIIYVLENNITWYSFPSISNEQLILKNFPIEK